MKRILMGILIICITLCLGLYGSVIIIERNNNAMNYKEKSYLSATDKINMKVLVIEINPKLTTKNNILASSYVKWSSREQVVDRIIEDIKYSSHGVVNPNIVKTEYLNEFPKQKNTDILNETMWLNIMSSSSWWQSTELDKLKPFDFDYEYIISKFNLVNRRNNGEFDQVWLAVLDPAQTYESMMVGRTAYWINGTPIIKDCDNFPIVNLSLSRIDVNFECFGHMAENVMAKVYKSTTNHYGRNTMTDTSNLSMWEKFVLSDYSSSRKRIRRECSFCTE